MLTNEKRVELELAIFEYLKSRGYNATCESFKSESMANIEEREQFSKLKDSSLERRWTVLSLQQHKILQLEGVVNSLQKELNEYKSGEIYKRRKSEERNYFLPKEPYKLELKGHRDSITCLAFHPVHSLIASSSDDSSIKIWDYESGHLEKSLRGHTNNVNFITFDTSGKLLASCSADLTIRIWDINNEQVVKILTGHEHNISCVIFLSTSDLIASASRDNTVKIWEVTTGHCKMTLKEASWVKRLACNHDGTMIATCNTDNNIRIWDLLTKKCMHTLRKHTHIVECLSFSEPTEEQIDTKAATTEDKKARNGDKKMRQYLISGGRDKMIYAWDTESGECVCTLKGHDNWVKDVFILPNMKYAISCSDDRSIRVWDLHKEICIHKISNAHSHFVTCLRVCKERPLIATGSVDTTIKIWQCY